MHSLYNFLQVESSFYHLTFTQTCYEKQAPLHNYWLNRLRVLLLGGCNFGCAESEGSCRMCILMFTNMSNICLYGIFDTFSCIITKTLVGSACPVTGWVYLPPAGLHLSCPQPPAQCHFLLFCKIPSGYHYMFHLALFIFWYLFHIYLHPTPCPVSFPIILYKSL